MEIILRFFDGCPNWQITERYLTTLIAEGLDATVGYEIIDGDQAARERGFCGSPTVLIDGVDPFAERSDPAGLACRVYNTELGPAGSPSIEQLRRAVATA